MFIAVVIMLIVLIYAYDAENITSINSWWLLCLCDRLEINKRLYKLSRAHAVQKMLIRVLFHFYAQSIYDRSNTGLPNLLTTWWQTPELKVAGELITTFE